MTYVYFNRITVWGLFNHFSYCLVDKHYARWGNNKRIKKNLEKVIVLKSTCDKCGEEFEIEVKTELIKNIEKTYFTCPHCKNEYIAFCTNQSVRRKQAEMKMLHKEARRAKTLRQLEKIQLKIENLEVQAKSEMEELKKSLLS